MVSLKALVELWQGIIKGCSAVQRRHRLFFIFRPLKFYNCLSARLVRRWHQQQACFPFDSWWALLLMLAVIAFLDFMWQRHTHIKRIKNVQAGSKRRIQTDGWFT